MKRLNKSQKIRAYIAKHPQAKAKEIANAVDVTQEYVHQVVYKMKKEAKSKKVTLNSQQVAVAKDAGITPERMAELVKQHSRPKRRMQSAEPRDIVATHHTDMVNHPPHYTNHPSGVECIQITEHMNFCLGNAIKYIWRADLKGSTIEDLEKAVFYVQKEIKRRKNSQTPSST